MRFPQSGFAWLTAVQVAWFKIANRPTKLLKRRSREVSDAAIDPEAKPSLSNLGLPSKLPSNLGFSTAMQIVAK